MDGKDGRVYINGNARGDAGRNARITCVTAALKKRCPSLSRFKFPTQYHFCHTSYDDTLAVAAASALEKMLPFILSSSLSLLTLFFWRPAASAPLGSATSDVLDIPIPTDSPELSGSQAQNLTFRPTNCITTLSPIAKTWYGTTSASGWNPQDCGPAITDFYRHDIVLRPNLPRDFSAHGVFPPSPPSPGAGPLSGIQTPRKFVSGSCTLSIINLDVVVPKLELQSLPGLQKPWGLTTWPEQDTENFRDIYSNVERIATGCLLHNQWPGWMQVGESAFTRGGFAFLDALGEPEQELTAFVRFR